jgi:hypothetical protein
MTAFRSCKMQHIIWQSTLSNNHGCDWEHLLCLFGLMNHKGMSLPKLNPYSFFPTSYIISFYFIQFAEPYEFTLYYFLLLLFLFVFILFYPLPIPQHKEPHFLECKMRFFTKVCCLNMSGHLKFKYEVLNRTEPNRLRHNIKIQKTFF